MKITEIRPYILESPGRPYVFVKVLTDAGLYGWGEGTLEMKQRTVVQAVRDLEGRLIGEDPTRVGHLWQRMYRHGFWRGGEAVLSAVSALEQALWDITGKAYGQPVYKLLGGAVRDYVPCYTHTGDPQRARELMEEGWQAFKAGPRGRGGRPSAALRAGSAAVDEVEIVEATAEMYAALREAVGPRVALMCDAHGRFRAPVSIRIARALEPSRLLFYEEPVPPDNVEELKLIRQAGLGMDIATGERAFTKWGFREMLANQWIDVIQPDICHDGGILETVKIAAMAETYHVQVAPHNPNGPVGTAASVHAAAVMPNLLLLEYALSATRDACQKGEPVRARNGRIALLEAPGLGIDLDEEYLEQHPMQSLHLWPGSFFADGSVADV